MLHASILGSGISRVASLSRVKSSVASAFIKNATRPATSINLSRASSHLDGKQPWNSVPGNVLNKAKGLWVCLEDLARLLLRLTDPWQVQASFD
jgi:hypothetical protein